MTPELSIALLLGGMLLLALLVEAAGRRRAHRLHLASRLERYARKETPMAKTPPSIRLALTVLQDAYRQAGMPYGRADADFARWVADRSAEGRRPSQPTATDPRIVTAQGPRLSQRM